MYNLFTVLSLRKFLFILLAMLQKIGSQICYSLEPVHIVSYYIKWVETSWTYSTVNTRVEVDCIYHPAPRMVVFIYHISYVALS